MTRKFDVVIGNPPYQEDSVGDSTHNMPIYNKFMDAAYEVATKVVLITPARFLFKAGYTPKAWNEKMLADPHLSVPIYVRDSSSLFPGTKIRAGIAVTSRDASRKGIPIGAFTAYPELNSILHKVIESGYEPLEAQGMTTGRSYRYTDKMHKEHPEASLILSDGHQHVLGPHAFQRLPFLFSEVKPTDPHTYAQVYGRDANKRVFRWIRRDYVTGPESLLKYKVAVPAANELNTLGQMAASEVLGPETAVTQTFLTIGAFETDEEARACLRYIKTKFARALLYALKATQHNPRSTWKYVPNQDFTENSDIDWSKSTREIDQQLYVKYELDADEIEFLEEKVNSME